MKEKFDIDYIDAVRAVGYAIWSWIALAGVLTMLVRQQSTSVLIIGSGTNEQLRESVPLERGVGGEGFVDTFVSLLTFDFGFSESLMKNVWPVIGSAVGSSVVLVAASLLITAVLSAGAYVLAKTDWGARIARIAGVLAGSVPGAAWLLSLYLLVSVRLSIPGLLEPGSNAAITAGAVGIALPLVSLVARTLGRQETLGGMPRMSVYRNARVATSWMVSSLVIVETIIGTGGVGSLWMSSIRSHDAPLFLATTVALTLPIVLVNAVFEGLSPGWRFPAAPETKPTVETDGGGGSVTDASFVDLVQRNRSVAGGAVTFAGFLVAGFVFPTVQTVLEPTNSQVIGKAVLSVASSVSLTVLLATGVGGIGGVFLAVAAVRSRHDEKRLRFAIDFPTNIPFVVLAGLVIFGLQIAHVSLNPLIVEFVVGGVVGFALVPLVFGVAQRELAAGAELPTTVVSVAEFLANAGVFVAFALWWFNLAPPRQYLQIGVWAVFIPILGVSLPALALLVLGDGLRTAAVQNS